MTKTLTEQWRDGELPAGFYYLEMKDGLVIIDHTIYVVGEKIYRWELSSVDYVKEVLGLVPDYMDCKGLIYDSIALDDARKRIDKLVSKTEQLEKKLEIATEALEYYADEKNYCLWALDEDGDLPEEAQHALKEMEGVK